MAEQNNHFPEMIEVGKKAKKASLQLSNLTHEARNRVLQEIADALQKNAEKIIAENEKDLELSKDSLATPLFNRLKLPLSKLQSAIQGVRDVEKLPDPIGAVTLHRKLDENLILKRFACPVGVLGIIFESRPDVLIQISCLAVKSGNAVILKGGKESLNSCKILTEVIRGALEASGVDPNVVQTLTTREEIRGLLTLDRYVDLIIPRGGNAFVRYVQTNTRIPVLGHADGICHIYVDKEIDGMEENALDIIVDSKTQYPSACNAVETILIHKDLSETFLPKLLETLKREQVEVRVCEATKKALKDGAEEYAVAKEDDWTSEYCDLVVALKTVSDFGEAVQHINDFGSRHTDCILSTNQETAETFISSVDAAGVYWNASTRFADGFRYGFGAEVGISTQKMPPRGPVGLEGLVTYKYSLIGKGKNLSEHTAATYAGDDPKPFLHQDLPLDQE